MWQARVIKVVGGVGLFLSLLTLASRLGGLHWTLDVLTHYHIQYAVGLLFCLMLLLLLRTWRPLFFVLLAALIVNLYLILPFFWPPAAQPVRAATDTPPFRAMALNISTSTAGYEQVVALIRERQPEIVFISEVRADLVALLQSELAESYPHLHAEPSRFTLGIAFLSRQPFQAVETVTVAGSTRRRYLRAVLDWHGQPITVVGIHPLPPMNGEWAASRNHEIQLMSAVAQQTTQPLILLGDLNASPWSQPMTDLMAQSGLRYAAKGYGIGLTWRLGGVLLGAPIDHILISPEWSVLDYTESGDIRSDHIPIQADLVLRHP
jgi:endonuclease/exonuclease/phosphatase (EEP) superfamily protein YafD